jgi:protein-disulfide isomerase
MRRCIFHFLLRNPHAPAAFVLLAALTLACAHSESPTPSAASPSAGSAAQTVSEAAAPTSLTSKPCGNGLPHGDTVACIRNRSITLAEIDQGGDHSLHEALEQLYRQRMIALYRVLSEDLLAREAKAQHTSVDALLDHEVNSQVLPVSDTDAKAFLKERLTTDTPSSPSDASGETPREWDPQRVRQAASYLMLKRRAERKRAYLEELFKHYDVKVNLDPPPPAPAEAIHGPMTPVIGSATAPVTFVVFSDYLCPYCKSLSRTLDTLLARYPADVRVIYRQFPVHPHADRLAEAALCADEQGHFSAYHRLLFERPAAGDDDLAPLATEAGLDRLAFTACLGSERNRVRVEDDLNEGKRLLIQGTPTLFVNGVRFEGTQSLDSLSARVEILRQTHPALAATRPTAAR